MMSRVLPRLRLWAHNRLPRWARTGIDTTDIVHDAVLHTLPKCSALDLDTEAALSAYLYKAVQNRLYDEQRRALRHGGVSALYDDLADTSLSPSDQVLQREHERRVHAALQQLSPLDQALIAGYVDLEYTYEQLGCMTGRSPNTARVALQRALTRLAAQMRDD
jgi:RNA polymerase sigma factor (sigma-70 family)